MYIYIVWVDWLYLLFFSQKIKIIISVKNKRINYKVYFCLNSINIAKLRLNTKKVVILNKTLRPPPNNIIFVIGSFILIPKWYNLKRTTTFLILLHVTKLMGMRVYQFCSLWILATCPKYVPQLEKYRKRSIHKSYVAKTICRRWRCTKAALSCTRIFRYSSSFKSFFV